MQEPAVWPIVQGYGGTGIQRSVSIVNSMNSVEGGHCRGCAVYKMCIVKAVQCTGGILYRMYSVQFTVCMVYYV